MNQSARYQSSVNNDPVVSKVFTPLWTEEQRLLKKLFEFGILEGHGVVKITTKLIALERDIFMNKKNKGEDDLE